jgi:2-polyprenyl-3-methyl-5-hydroxy-6-metoxy-1,4-benzoquinol methylase
MPDKFKSRTYQLEQMDDFTSKGEIIRKTLFELDFINNWLGGYRVTLDGLDQLVDGNEEDEIHIADIGCGGGNTLFRIKRWMDKRKLPVKLTGLDANPNIIVMAKEASGNPDPVSYRVTNVLEDPFDQQTFDIVNCTLLLHHFNDEQLINFLTKIKRITRRGIVINDLHRHWFAYHSIRLLTQWFSHSEMVVHDAPLSVLRAFRKEELEALLSSAGITDYTITWKWAFRWQVVIRCKNY